MQSPKNTELMPEFLRRWKCTYACQRPSQKLIREHEMTKSPNFRSSRTRSSGPDTRHLVMATSLEDVFSSLQPEARRQTSDTAAREAAIRTLHDWCVLHDENGNKREKFWTEQQERGKATEAL